jgi:AraC family transcriptional regulator
MTQSHNSIAIVSSDKYEKFHPGKVQQTSRSMSWDGLLFTRYSHPHTSHGSPRPATTEHILAFSDNGAVKGDYSMNGGKWRPYIWRHKEWFIGQAFENQRDSRWHSLCAENVELSVCYMHLSPKVLERVALEAGETHCGSIEIPHCMSIQDPLMYQIGISLRDELSRANPCGKIFVESAANLIAVQLLRHYSTRKVQIKELNPRKNSSKLKRSLNYIQEHLDQELSLEILARHANLSPYHFARIFKQCTGVAPHRFIIEARMAKAKELLRYSAMPVYLIALEVGYSCNYFAQIFSREVGMSPQRYRDQAG